MIILYYFCKVNYSDADEAPASDLSCSTCIVHHLENKTYYITYKYSTNYNPPIHHVFCRHAPTSYCQAQAESKLGIAQPQLFNLYSYIFYILCNVYSTIWWNPKANAKLISPVFLTDITNEKLTNCRAGNSEIVEISIQDWLTKYRET